MKQIMWARSIADSKNAELVALTIQATAAKYAVAELQAAVNSLQTKSAQFALFLSQATDNQAAALSNFNLARDAVASVSTVSSSVAMAALQVAKANTQAQTVSSAMAELIGKLIFSVEFINKVTQLINKQKANNPLLPDSLIAIMAKTSSAANNAIALTLTAMQSCYVAEATLQESDKLCSLGKKQSATLTHAMTVGWNTLHDVATDGTPPAAAGIERLLADAYALAQVNYQQALGDSSSVARQLAFAQANLAAATIQLNSYKSGLAAETAAAYAA